MAPPGALLLRLSVPSEGDLRGLGPELAARVAETFDRAYDGAAVSAALEGVAAQVTSAGQDGDIAFEFRTLDGDLLIEARSGNRTSEVRCARPS